LEIGTMIRPTILLIARDSSLIESVNRLVCSLEGLCFETLESVEVFPQLPCPNIALLLVHLPDNETLADAAALGLARLCPTVVLSDAPQEDQAAAWLRAGVVDYLGSPFDQAKLACHIRSCVRGSDSAGYGQPLNSSSPSFYVLDPHMNVLMEQVRRVAPQDTTLLFSGETGTGKTRLARLIHELSPRRQEPFLTLDCGAMSPTLIESEIFGHVKGAYTGADRDRLGKLAAAGNGTLLLDEVNALPRSLQSRLLRAVDERVFEPVGSNKTQKIQARLIAISNAPLEGEVAEGRFRADLYYRLNVVSFQLPPLRERRQAIIPLANKFLAEFAARNRPDVTSASPEALRIIQDYSWPGNVRELRNVIERAVALAPGPSIRVKDLPEAICSTPARNGRSVSTWQAPTWQAPTWQAPQRSSSLSQTREMVEIERIVEVLTKHRNNRLRAAIELGISRMGLYKKLRKYGLMKFSPLANGDNGHVGHNGHGHNGHGHNGPEDRDAEAYLENPYRAESDHVRDENGQTSGVCPHATAEGDCHIAGL
jgi:DNA-binding NtrC family response regulator